MELENLPSLGPIFHALYVQYGSSIDPELLASALASHLPQPARVFSIESDLLMPEEGRALAGALTHSATVLIIGSSESRLIQCLGHQWPEYCEHPSAAPVSFFRHVTVEPTEDLSKLACIYLLIPTLTRAHDSDRPGVFRLTDSDSHRLASLAANSPSSPEPLGCRGARIVSAGISMRDLCLLHERDSRLIAARPRSLDQFINATEPLSWRDLQAVLSAQPEIWLLDYLRERLSPEQYNFGMAAVKFIHEHKDAVVEHIYPDIYSAVWAMEKVLSPGAIFRGQFQAEWGLESTLMRPNADGTLDVAELLRRTELTSDFISSVRQRSTELFGKQLDEDSLLAVAQHFGFPTPLLDFTESFRVAAFFATQKAACLEEAEPPVGVIYCIFSADQKHTQIDRPEDNRLLQWAGVRLGSLHVIQPDIPDSDDRIRRQRGVFVGGYRARHLQAVTIDRIYFKQHAGLTFEDPRSGISPEQLLPIRTTLSNLADEVRCRARTPPPMSSLLSRTPLSDSNLIGSAGAHLYWHMRFGQKYLSRLQQQANRIAAAPLYQAIETVLNQYFAMAKVQADISSYPDRGQSQSWTSPIHKTIASLEQAAGLPEGEMWGLVQKQLPRGFEYGGHVCFDVPNSWSESARLAFSCAIFCIAWEHLRCVPGLRAEELVQSATGFLHGL